MKAALSLAVLALSLVGCRGKPAIQPSARYATAAAVVDGAVYVAGGLVRGGGKDAAVATLEAYDPDSRNWTRCTPMPTARSFAAAVAFDGKLYVFGGLDPEGKALDSAEAYDPDSDSWERLPGMGRARSRLAAVVHRNRSILVGGGMDASGSNLDSVRVFLPDGWAESEGKTWREWSDLPSARHGFALVDAEDATEKVFAVGGFDENGSLAVVEVFGVGTVKVRDENGKLKWPGATTTDGRTGVVTSLDKDYEGYGWWPGPPLKEPRGFFGLATIGRTVYAVGGRCAAIPKTEVLDMDKSKEGWRTAAPLPMDLCRFSMVAWKGHLLVFGGETEFGRTINEQVLEYDPDSDAWTVR